MWDTLIALPGIPAGALLSSGGGTSRHALDFVVAAFALTELAIIAWFAFRGWKASLGCAVAIGLWSTLMSVFVYAMYRA
jgi:hypothetical protein